VIKDWGMNAERMKGQKLIPRLVSSSLLAPASKNGPMPSVLSSLPCHSSAALLGILDASNGD
jgi:hypothetical protein